MAAEKRQSEELNRSTAFDNKLRPTDFAGFVGQDKIRDRLMLAVEAAKARSSQLWDEAEKAIEIFGERAWFMHAFAQQLRTRKN